MYVSFLIQWNLYFHFASTAMNNRILTRKATSYILHCFSLIGFLQITASSYYLCGIKSRVIANLCLISIILTF